VCPFPRFPSFREARTETLDASLKEKVNRDCFPESGIGRLTSPPGKDPMMSTDATNPYQPMRPLDPDEHDRLRHSIETFGVLAPVVFAADGNPIDGHHRKAIAEELGIEYPAVTLDLVGDDAIAAAVELNVARRHLNKTERRAQVLQLRLDGASVRTIAKVTGWGIGTVHRDLDAAGVPVEHVDHVVGRDGKQYQPRSTKTTKTKTKKPTRAANVVVPLDRTRVSEEEPARFSRTLDAARAIAGAATASESVDLGRAEREIEDAILHVRAAVKANERIRTEKLFHATGAKQWATYLKCRWTEELWFFALLDGVPREEPAAPNGQVCDSDGAELHVDDIVKFIGGRKRYVVKAVGAGALELRDEAGSTTRTPSPAKVTKLP
jgi:ParB-like chromosome segregation protein Spo0J